MIKDELIETFYGVDHYVKYHGWTTNPFAFVSMKDAEAYIDIYLPKRVVRIVPYNRNKGVNSG